MSLNKPKLDSLSQWQMCGHLGICTILMIAPLSSYADEPVTPISDPHSPYACGVGDPAYKDEVINLYKDRASAVAGCKAQNPRTCLAQSYMYCHSFYTLHQEDGSFWEYHRAPKINRCPPEFPVVLPGGRCGPAAEGENPKEVGSPSCGVGNPIDTATGNKYQIEKDILPLSPTSIAFSRHYSSVRGAVSTEMGYGWSHNYKQALKDFREEDSSYVSISRADGKTYSFSPYGAEWEGDPDVPLKLVELRDEENTTTGWQVMMPDGSVEEYDEGGRWVAFSTPNGYSESLHYDDRGRLISVASNFGGELAFDYDAQGRITTLQTGTGETYRYNYDASGNLTQYVSPNISPESGDNLVRTYHYNEPACTSGNNLPHTLTGITDERGVRYATWEYDTKGRAISSQHAGQEKVTLDYTHVSDENGPRVTVTNALGQKTTYHYKSLYGVRKIIRVERHPSANCEAASQYVTYNSSGLPQEVTDWEGRVTRYYYDRQGRRTELYEGEGRTIETTWHSQFFHLPVTITEPKRVITFSYDDEGLLIKQTVTPR